jgi:hypothetical protein
VDIATHAFFSSLAAFFSEYPDEEVMMLAVSVLVLGSVDLLPKCMFSATRGGSSSVKLNSVVAGLCGSLSRPGDDIDEAVEAVVAIE